MKKQICFPVRERLKESVGFDRWEILNRFGEEANYGEIYSVCLKNNCDYVLKYLPFESENTQEGIVNEVNIQTECAKFNLCLPVIDAWLCDKGGAIVMGKLDYTLANLFLLYKSDNVRKKILHEMLFLIQTLHSHNFYHGDLHLNNIMVKVGNFDIDVEENNDEDELYELYHYKYYFIDFGMGGILNGKESENERRKYRDYSYAYDHLQDLEEEDPTLENTVQIMREFMEKFE